MPAEVNVHDVVEEVKVVKRKLDRGGGGWPNEIYFRKQVAQASSKVKCNLALTWPGTGGVIIAIKSTKFSASSVFA